MGHLTWYSNHIIVLVILQCFSNKVSRFDLSGCNLRYLTKIGLKLTLDSSFENQCDFTITWLILWAQFGQVTTWFWSVCVNSQIFGTHLTAWQIMKTRNMKKFIRFWVSILSSSGPGRRILISLQNMASIDRSAPDRVHIQSTRSGTQI